MKEFKTINGKHKEIEYKIKIEKFLFRVNFEYTQEIKWAFCEINIPVSEKKYFKRAMKKMDLFLISWCPFYKEEENIIGINIILDEEFISENEEFDFVEIYLKILIEKFLVIKQQKLKRKIHRIKKNPNNFSETSEELEEKVKKINSKEEKLEKEIFYNVENKVNSLDRDEQFELYLKKEHIDRIQGVVLG